MGTIYNIPYVGELSFTNTGYTADLPYTNMNQSQKDAVDIISNIGILYAPYEWVASAGYNDYLGFYVDGNSYYIGYSRVDGSIYFAYHKGIYANVNKSTITSGVYIGDFPHNISDLPSGVDAYNSRAELNAALSAIILYPITYSYTNSTISGPEEAAVGDTVVVSVTFPDGYGIINDSNIYVTNNGVVIPSTYSNGQLTFTMPDPS